MKRTALAILFLLVFLVLLVSPSFATDICGNMTFSNLGQGGSEDVLIYAYNGTSEAQELQGQWNTSSPDVPAYCGDVNVVIRPSAQSRFNNPTLFLSDMVSTFETFAPAIVVLGILGIILLRFWR